MASTILADNGVSSGSAGIKTTADSTGALALQTTTAGGAATTAVTIDSSQNVGIGTSSPQAKFVVSNSGAQGIEFGYSAGLSANYMQSFNRNTSADVDMAYYMGSTTGSHKFYTSATERMRIDSSGNLLLNTTSNVAAARQSILFDGSAQQALAIRTTYATLGSTYLTFQNSATTQTGFISQNGTATVSYSTSSDYRLKENIEPMTGALAKVSALKPCTYKWKDSGEDGQGFIAHELAEICPDAVVGEKDAVDADGNPKYQGIDTSFLVATLTAAIQEQQALITTLTERITALEAK